MSLTSRGKCSISLLIGIQLRKPSYQYSRSIIRKRIHFSAMPQTAHGHQYGLATKLIQPQVYNLNRGTLDQKEGGCLHYRPMHSQETQIKINACSSPLPPTQAWHYRGQTEYVSPCSCSVALHLWHLSQKKEHEDHASLKMTQS